MRYVLVMLGSLVGLVIVAWLLLCLLISVGCIYPANYAEQKINEAYDTILRADKVTAEMIPALCDYVIFSENGEKIGGDLSEQYEQIAWNVAKYGNASGKYFYKVIVRENEYVVLQYRLTPQYHSAFLREHFIGPQNVMSIMSVIGAVAIIIIPSIRFGKRIKKQMQPVLDAIGQIKDQNLEYETSCSGIKEFDDCLSAIDDMRDALRESLEKQWKTEQEKKQQMSALAHDIKTPLTIVRGNAELLSETELTTEQKKNITYVLNGTTQIPVVPEYDYTEVAATITSLDEKIAIIKHALNVTNSNEKVRVGDAEMSIDTILIKMAQLNKRKSVLDQMRKQLPKAREEQRSYMSRNTVPEYRYINYDLELIKKEYETVSKTIMEMQMALDKYNQTVQFEVDI
ncbi:hypothetical protein WAL18_14170 [Waltera acetigignens]